MKIKIFYKDDREPEIIENVVRVVEMDEHTNVTAHKSKKYRTRFYNKRLITRHLLGVKKVHIKMEE